MASTSALTIGRKDYEDYISLLPDCLIHHIFSFLPTRDVIKTCVLSKRWQFVWTTISDLGFSVSSYHDSFVDRVLTHYVGPKVKKFHLDVILNFDFFNPSKIDPWVHFAINHQVEDLLLDVYSYQYTPWGHYLEKAEDYTLHPLLYNCSSLTKLCLTGCHFPFSESISWSSLKSLSIDNVTSDVLQKILMGSPVLEYLNLTDCWSVEGIRIHSRSLRELVIINADVIGPPLHISTPHLLSLRVRGAHFYEAIRIIEAPSLVEAELDFGGPAKSDSCLLKEMLCKLQNATRILSGAWCLWVMSPLKVEDMQISLLNCKSLTLSMPIPKFSFPAIANMLATAPNLEKLVIIFKLPDCVSYISDLDSRNVDHESYWHIKKQFKRWARHLKNVEIFGFYTCLRSKYEELLLLVKFLLGHASVLGNMVIKVKSHEQDLESVDSLKLLEVARRLQSYHKASRDAAVILNYLEEVPQKRRKKGVRVTTKCLHIGHKNA
ncbi:F-box/LRR-repeat protein At5g02910-like [Syzygium oleosum]|uniref:F-box/LRR-repeat protein At5g02910-like n=1 Tax=Syzygium oleosum TaxID=219896 RepID=UPI0024B8C0D4|nr:F-box/LRR-repeat protein At5g02910-like [Syzygium oleosum]XP_056158474.1 F-box/LRR-repeat protein At5g02910-like [Syzygium oleosum]